MKFRGSVALTVLLLAAVSFGQDLNTSWKHGSERTKCEDLEISSSDYEVARAEQQFTIPAGQAVNVIASKNGGVYVSGWDQPQYSVTACKAALAEKAADARQLLGQVNVVNNGGQITSTGPDDRRWLIHYIVRVPHNAEFTAESYNGPMSVRDADGHISVKSHNGPLSFRHFTGNGEGETTNGPVSVKASQGNIRVSTTNGPLTLDIDRAQYDGELNASTKNGPVTLHVPEGFTTAFLVEGGYGPMSCSSSICKQANVIRERGSRRIEFGESPKIKASTHNGPVSVAARGDTL